MRTVADQQSCEDYDTDMALLRLVPDTVTERDLVAHFVASHLATTPAGRDDARWHVTGEWTEDGYLSVQLVIDSGDVLGSLMDAATVVNGRAWVVQRDGHPGGLCAHWALDASPRNRAQNNVAGYGPVMTGEAVSVLVVSATPQDRGVRIALRIVDGQVTIPMWSEHPATIGDLSDEMRAAIKAALPQDEDTITTERFRALVAAGLRLVTTEPDRVRAALGVGADEPGIAVTTGNPERGDG